MKGLKLKWRVLLIVGIICAIFVLPIVFQRFPLFQNILYHIDRRSQSGPLSGAEYSSDNRIARGDSVAIGKDHVLYGFIPEDEEWPVLMLFKKGEPRWMWARLLRVEMPIGEESSNFPYFSEFSLKEVVETKNEYRIGMEYMWDWSGREHGYIFISKDFVFSHFTLK